MISENVTWEEMKDFLGKRSKTLKYIERPGFYKIWGLDDYLVLITHIQITEPRNADQVDFEDNIKRQAEGIFEKKRAPQTTGPGPRANARGGRPQGS